MARPKGKSNTRRTGLLYQGVELTKISRKFLADTGEPLSGCLIVEAELSWCQAKDRDARSYYETVALGEYRKRLLAGYSYRIAWYYAAKLGRRQWERQYDPNGRHDDFGIEGKTWKQVMRYHPKSRLVRIANW